MHGKKYLFYPYTDKSYGFIKGLLCLNLEFDVISPLGYGLCGKDISYVVNRTEDGKKIKDINYVDFSLYNTLIISSEINHRMYQELETVIRNARENEMEIINLGTRFDLDTMTFNDKEGNTSSNGEIQQMISRINELGLPYYTTKTPIIAVGGILKTIDDFNISLQLKLEFEKQGYKAELITNDEDGKFFNCTKYPNVYMDSTVGAEIQIEKLNRYIQTIETIKNPDIIILHIPQGLIRYNDYFTNSFGVHTFILGQSLQVDYFILNLGNSIIDDKYFEKLDEYFRIVLGQKIDIINLTNSQYEDLFERTEDLKHPLYLDESKINTIVNSYEGEYNVTNLNCYTNLHETVENIINKFE